MEPKYLGCWSEKDWKGRIGIESMLSDFEIKDIGDFKVLIACYEQGGYEGSATVILEKNGQLYEVYAGHCSCYGLEGQFNPEPVTLDALKANLDRGYHFGGCEKEVRELVERLA